LQFLLFYLFFIFGLIWGTGLLLRLEWMGEVPRDRLFDDSHFWEVPEEAPVAASGGHDTQAVPVFERMDSQDSKC